MLLVIFWVYRVDFLLLIVGYIYDGVLGFELVDIDFQTDMFVLNVYWEGFYDFYFVIKEYYISVGTCFFCDDVIGR